LPRTAINTEPMTFEQYLVVEEKREIRHEFMDGFIFAMAGAAMRTTQFH
jgi:Uma2 family endonuclease